MVARLVRPVLVAAFIAGFGFAGITRAGDVQIDLDPATDLFGNQIEVIQGYNWGGDWALAFGIYDTGASVVTLSATDRAFFDLLGAPVPIKVPDGAVADAIDGVIVGDVSMPMTFWTDGLHAVSFSWDAGLGLDFNYDLTGGVTVPGVQVFVGTDTGSAQLPNIAGTPVHFGSIAGTSAFPAAKVDMLGYEFDLGAFFADDPSWASLFAGIVLYMPDLSFVPAGTRLAAIPGSTTDPVRIPLTLFGPENYSNPGNEVTVAPNPVQEQVSLGEALATVSNAVFLFDTGASISVISTAIAQALGFDLNSPETTIDIMGAAGSPITVPGFTVDWLALPIDTDFDGVVDGELRFTNAPVFVVDLVEGLDGILGMNLWSWARELLYDPYDPLGPSLQATFLLTRETLSPEEQDALESLAEANPLLGQLFGISSGPLSFPRFEIQGGPTGGEVIPEPNTACLLILGAAALGLTWNRRRKTLERDFSRTAA
ncbi:retropepsin-like aspartic protease [Thermogutta sp.]|uniref:retropepsin-like aspartic protease n=1 Tax=Thermogutta sp. TaxID=1962930 RepID=UPI003C7AF6A0